MMSRQKITSIIAWNLPILGGLGVFGHNKQEKFVSPFDLFKTNRSIGFCTLKIEILAKLKRGTKSSEKLRKNVIIG